MTTVPEDMDYDQWVLITVPGDMDHDDGAWGILVHIPSGDMDQVLVTKNTVNG